MANIKTDNFSSIPERVLLFCKNNGYPVESTKTQRIIGPKAHRPPPMQGTEIFVSNIPKYLLEDHLIPFFEKIGEIYKFRLMLTHSEYNRGTAFITYNTSKCADESVQYFNGREILLGQTVLAEKSKENRRLFIGGIPDTKTKDEVWHELQKLGIKGIVDVIMYRSYSDKNRNRGFVFVEFNSHQEAAQARFSYKDSIIFGQRVSVDWSSPINDVTEDIMSKVKILFLRNLNVSQERDEFVELVNNIIGGLFTVEKIYKFRDYAFIHFKTRRDAQKAMWELKTFYKNSSMDVEIEWAKPPQKNKKGQASKSSGSDNECTPTPTKCNCVCKHSYVPSQIHSEPRSDLENAYMKSNLTKLEFDSHLQRVPVNRAPFLNLHNNNNDYSHLASPLPSPLSTSKLSSGMDRIPNLQSPLSFIEGSPMDSFWEVGADLPKSSNFKN